ncbi:hypothetical protein SGLAM104S_02090 [Streptomyces glaucescens]
MKPLLQLYGGRIEPLEKVRTASRAIARLEEVVAERAGAARRHRRPPSRGGGPRLALAERLRARVPGLGELHVRGRGGDEGAHGTRAAGGCGRLTVRACPEASSAALSVRPCPGFSLVSDGVVHKRKVVPGNRADHREDAELSHPRRMALRARSRITSATSGPGRGPASDGRAAVPAVRRCAAGGPGSGTRPPTNCGDAHGCCSGSRGLDHRCRTRAAQRRTGPSRSRVGSGSRGRRPESAEAGAAWRGRARLALRERMPVWLHGPGSDWNGGACWR